MVFFRLDDLQDQLGTLKITGISVCWGEGLGKWGLNQSSIQGIFGQIIFNNWQKTSDGVVDKNSVLKLLAQLLKTIFTGMNDI